MPPAPGHYYWHLNEVRHRRLVRVIYVRSTHAKVYDEHGVDFYVGDPLVSLSPANPWPWVRWGFEAHRPLASGVDEDMGPLFGSEPTEEELDSQALGFANRQLEKQWAKLGQVATAATPRPVVYLVMPREELWWCNSHQRRAYHYDRRLTRVVCTPSYPGGLACPCRCVNLTGLCELVDEAPTTIQGGSADNFTS